MGLRLGLIFFHDDAVDTQNLTETVIFIFCKLDTSRTETKLQSGGCSGSLKCKNVSLVVFLNILTHCHHSPKSRLQ